MLWKQWRTSTIVCALILDIQPSSGCTNLRAKGSITASCTFKILKLLNNACGHPSKKSSEQEYICHVSQCLTLPDHPYIILEALNLNLPLL